MVQRSSPRASRPRRTFTREFKIGAVRLVTEGGRKVAEVARDLDIDPNLLHRWKAQLKAEAEKAFPGKGNLSAEHEELIRLRRENARLKQDIDFLKKTAAFFAREQK